MSQIHGMKLAFKDPKMYLLAIGYHCECLQPWRTPCFLKLF